MDNDQKRQYFNELAPRWDSFPTIPNAASKIRSYLERSRHPHPQQILDVGCGTGILIANLIEMYPEAQLIVEMDYAEQMLLENARKFPDRRVLHIHGDVRMLPFVVPTFDLILCFSALPHFDDSYSALSQFFRALRPGGILTIGHMAASQELNEFHHALEAPVNHDHLLPAKELSVILEQLGASSIVAEEEKEWFFVRAEKAPSC
jgi:ubiquinone/menaquinone biosynthesis C-methylase UbiE